MKFEKIKATMMAAAIVMGGALPSMAVSVTPDEFLGSGLIETGGNPSAEIALLAAVVYHGLDGIRLLMVNWFKVTDYRKSLFYAVLAVSVLLVIAGGIPILLFMLEG